MRPDRTQEYKEAIERYYGEMNKSDEFDCRLSGSWEVSVGEIDTFGERPSRAVPQTFTLTRSAVHIWEYKGFPGFESVKRQVKESRVRLYTLSACSWWLRSFAQGHLETFNHEIMPLVFSRENQLCQEFAFWQTARPQEKGGIYELRSYQLQPGALLEWEHEWRVGLEARISSGHHPIGAWFSQIGRLHEVHHMWHVRTCTLYCPCCMLMSSACSTRASSTGGKCAKRHGRSSRGPPPSTRCAARPSSRLSGCPGLKMSLMAAQTVKLAQSMQTSILQPLPFSPLR